ncbi:MAG: hypothetical protein L0Z50_07665 [Verrucomicrobiales bacterium]|nr:hypothetical protein [Verrucomicrobiales bacterium]
MFNLQEWIHKFEVGEGVRHIKLAAALLGLLALTAIYDIREFKNFATQEAMDSAQLARNIAEGHGFTTQFIRPLSILLMQQQMPPGIPVLKDPHPDLANPPVYPLLLAALMKVLPFDFQVNTAAVGPSSHQPEVLIALFNQLLFFIGIFVLFRVALRLFDRAVAWTSAIVFAGADLLWRFSVSGLSTIWLILLFLLITWCLVSMEQSHREGQRSNTWFLAMAAAVGILTGLGAMTRYSFAWLIVPIAAFIVLFFGQRRFVLAGVAVATCVVMMVPWLARNFSVSGTFFGIEGYALYQGTEQFPDSRLERSLNSDFETELEGVGAVAILRKLLVNTATIVTNDLPKLTGTWVSGLFLVSLLVPFRNPALTRLRWFTLMVIAVLVVAQALARTHLTSDVPEVNSENLLALASPLVFVFGTGLFFVLLDQIEFSFTPLRPVVAATFPVVICAPLLLTLLPPRSYPLAWPPYFPSRIQVVGSWFGKNELMMSDMPWAVAWYGNRKCVWTTLDAPLETARAGGADFFAIYDFQKPIAGLYLTTLTSNAAIFAAAAKAPSVAWSEFMLGSIFKTNVPAGFPLKYAITAFIDDGQLFLADRPRWSSK